VNAVVPPWHHRLIWGFAGAFVTPPLPRSSNRTLGRCALPLRSSTGFRRMLSLQHCCATVAQPSHLEFSRNPRFRSSVDRAGVLRTTFRDAPKILPSQSQIAEHSDCWLGTGDTRKSANLSVGPP
jgi:hypothetical protein